MSTEQEKESFSLKRNRGAEGGLDVLGGSGLLLGDKKRRKSNSQALLSEYAPPPIPSSDHLIAANPFDDGYNSPSLKLPPPAIPFFGHSHYPGFSGYGLPRKRVSTPYHAQPFPQNPTGFNRGFTYGGGSGLGEHISPKQDGPNQNCEENSTPGDSLKLNGILPSGGKSPRATDTVDYHARRTDGNGCNKVVNRRSTSSSSEPVYPCGICLSEVNDDQEAILCEASCQKWFHRVCTGMTETAYNLLTAETSAVWGCDGCMEERGTPPSEGPSST